MNQQTELIAEFNSKTLHQIIIDSVVGKRIKLYREEYSEWQYRDYDNRPLFNYSVCQWPDYKESAICEIIDVVLNDKKEYKMELTVNDNGKIGKVHIRLTENLKFVR